MMRTHKLITLIAVAAFCVAATAFAHDFNGETLSYEFGWKGIPAADATVKIRDGKCDKPCYDIKIELKGKKYLDLFWKVRDRFESTCLKENYATQRFAFFQREGNFNLDTEVRLDKSAGRLRSTRFRIDKNKNYKDKSAGPEVVFGPLASLLYMRSQALNVGDSQSVDVFDGKRTHTLYWQVAAKEKIKIGLGQYNTLKLLPRITKSSSKDDKSKVEKVRKVTIWVSDDPSHTVLKIESEAFVGSVYAELVNGWP